MLDRLIVLLPQAWFEYRDRGLARARSGDTRNAVKDLDFYLAHVPDGLDISAVQLQLSELRQGRR